MANVRSRGWCFTINNPSEWDKIDREGLISVASYVVTGNEVGAEGTPHWQGFAYFKERKSFRQLQQLLPRAHLERSRGTNVQAIEYCKKDGDFQEWGTVPSGPKGQEDKWREVLLLARAGQLDAVEEKFPAIFIRYHAKLLGLHKPERPIILESLENEWWVGATGTGKSSTLWRLYPTHYQKSLNKWWDGYMGEDTVAIEEWSPKNECTSSQLKVWADRYPFSAEIKGGTLQKIRPRRIIVLSNFSIDDCFCLSQDLEPIKRRFKIKHFYSL